MCFYDFLQCLILDNLVFYDFLQLNITKIRSNVSDCKIIFPERTILYMSTTDDYVQSVFN